MSNRILAPEGSIPRRVSADGHFQWKVRTSKNRKGRKFTEFAYYSVPVSPGSQVLVIEQEAKLQVFSKSTGQLLCSHSKEKIPRAHATDPVHIKDLSLDWLFSRVEGHYPTKDIQKWKLLYKFDGVKSYRKIMREKRSLDRLNQKGAKK